MDILRNSLNLFFPPSKETVPAKDSAPEPVVDRKAVPPNREVLLSWESPTRTFRPRTPAFYKRIITLIFAFGIVLVLAGQFPLLIVLVSIAVLFYVLSSVPPERTKHEIDNHGINYLGRQYYWHEFRYFFFTHEGNFDILNVDTKEPLPGRLIMLLEGVTLEQVSNLMGSHLPLQKEPPRQMFEDFFKILASKLSLD